MAGIKVTLISEGFDDLFDQWARNDGRPRIERSLSAAQGSAPVASGEYAASLRVELVHTDRPVWRVVSDAPHAHIVEADTGNLARALDAGR